MSKDGIQKWAHLIDHTMLNAQRTEFDIVRLCDEAKKWNFFSVCVNPKWVKLCSEQLDKCQSVPITVVGFPLGSNKTSIKVAETQEAIEDGAKEIDMVLDIGAVVGDDWETVAKDIKAVTSSCGPIPVKVILETAYLHQLQIEQACKCAVDNGASFVKTSTGFAPKGAELETVKFMRQCVGPEIGVKASGGIRDAKTLQAFIEAGASRVGTSSSNTIMEELLNGY